ncbi:MAG: DUF935 domain-containing protein, partial [Fimbriimonadaceae bacterium]|nr:DUF935 domain-containing protein [Fimbriimonadaceae bacterium]
MASEADMRALTQRISTVGGLRQGLNGQRVTPLAFDDLTGERGLQVYREMLRQPAISAGVEIWKSLILGAEGTVSPRALPDGDPDVGRAEEIADFCRKALDGLHEPLPLVLEELLEALAIKAAPAEIEWEFREMDGVRRLVPGRLAVKRREDISFVEDEFGRRLGYLPRNQTIWNGPPAPLEKFLVIEFPETVLRSAYNPYVFAMKTMPEFFRFMGLMATPSVVGILPPSSGLGTKPGRKTPEQVMLEDIERFQGASAMVVANGADLKLIEAKSDGRAFLEALDRCDRQMLLGVLGAYQSVLEAKNSNKANGENASGLLMRAVQRKRERVAHQVTAQLLRPLTTLNFPDAAHLAPLFEFSRSVAEDFVALADAVAKLVSSGYLTPELWPQVDALL